MLRTIEVRLRPHLEDCVGKGLAGKIVDALGLPIKDISIVKVYTVEGLDDGQVARAMDAAALHDPVLHDARTGPFATDADWVLEVGLRPGVTDNEGRTARDTLAMVLDLPRNFAVYTATQYHIRADEAVARLSLDDIEHIAKDLLANELIMRFNIKSGAQWQAMPGFPAQAARVTGEASDAVQNIPISLMTDDEMMAFSRENTLALSLEEMHAIRDFYAREDICKARAARGLACEPTDAEVEMLAQTWSEHCKHKIMASRVDYANKDTGRRETINSLYKTNIQGTTKKIRQRLGGRDFCRSVFKDNAGVVSFTDSHDLCIKVETHNSPSALDPYGGALTGIVGVNRDPMGTGIGAELVCNTDVFCFASPFYEKELPPRLLHPRRIMEGVREGVEHGGNKSGVPTVNGSVVFDERFIGKPLVFCGTVGMLPTEINGKPGHYKKALPGDIIVMAGGRIGKDGIHGATFSSEELHEGSPATAVQIGDPITQRKLYDFVIRARNLGLYNAITDNGAGGLSSSVGEMAEDTGGCVLDLAKAPLKYDGLRPWEILLSEAQERMTLAVPKEKLGEFLRLAGELDVEASAMGEFTDSGFFHAVYNDKDVVWLPMEFLHGGVPQMRLEAVWERPAAYPWAGRELGVQGVAKTIPDIMKAKELDHGKLLLRMLGRLNICSKEYMIRQYDHEVKGGSVVKPLVGVKRDGPGDAAALRPLLGGKTGMILSHGICPKFSDMDTYWMMANAIDEAVRNAVAVGADPSRLAGVDNFCWCDPVQSEKTPDGRYKMAQLVRANKALEHFCLAYGVPCVSGKDSMKNDYTGGSEKISIPPTVLFSVLGLLPDVEKAVTSDFKKPGDLVYILGVTRNELAGSELASELGFSGGIVPEVDAMSAKERYARLFAAMQDGLISACHDLSDGGLAVALAEMCIGGRLGAEIDLEKIPQKGCALAEEILYSETPSRLLVSVPEAARQRFEDIFRPGDEIDAAHIGRVGEASSLNVRFRGETVIACPVDSAAAAFKATLDW